ncbi:MAG: sulfatase/phosphatase domain-containing protein [Planctomycetaceae bacterium]
MFTSDHGYHLGDHTFSLKSNVHEQVTRVPLIISSPRFDAGRTAAITELVDLYPTLCELTAQPVPEDLHGTSLVPVLETHNADGKAEAISFSKGACWRTRDWAYMLYNDGGEELYDMRNDPGQFHNPAADPEHAAVRQRMSRQLSTRLAEYQLRTKQNHSAVGQRQFDRLSVRVHNEVATFYMWYGRPDSV